MPHVGAVWARVGADVGHGGCPSAADEGARPHPRGIHKVPEGLAGVGADNSRSDNDNSATLNTDNRITRPLKPSQLAALDHGNSPPLTGDTL
eukprot:10234554-Lingulodinium_polyedra.AAC.1